LHEVATGGLAPDEVVEGMRLIIDRDRAELLKAEATSVDSAARVVHTTASPVSYDKLVVALGAEINMHMVPGVAEHALPLKTLADAQTLRNRFAELFQAASQTTDHDEHKRLMSVVIVGGGPTGVELAAEIAELFERTFKRFYRRNIHPGELSLTLIHSGADLIAEFHPKLRARALEILRRRGVKVHLNMQVASVDAQGVMLAGGERMPAGTVIWTAGVKPLAIPASPAWPFTDKHRIDVDETLKVRDRDDVWAMGDNAGSWPLRAQVAVQQAPIVADNILASINGTAPRSFTYRSLGDLVSLGQWQAVGDVGGIRWTGPVAWWLWRTVYLFKFASWSKRLKIMLDWTIHLFTPRDIVVK
jgi:NADH dehydrogenase